MMDREGTTKGARSGAGRPAGRKIRFAEAGILFVLTLALAVVAGVQFLGCGERKQEAAATAAVAATALPADTAVTEPADSSVLVTEYLRPVTYEEAEQAYQAGSHAEAAELFAAYCGSRPDNAWGYYMLGLSRWKAGDPDGAREGLERALEINPDHFKSHQNLARVLLELDRPAEALAHAEAAVAADPLAPDTWRVLGRVLDESGRAPEAIEAYMGALRLDPDDAWSLNNLGFLLVRQERFAEALPALARAATLRPAEAAFQNNLGVALERTGRFQAAAVAYAAAAEAESGHERAAASRDRVEALAAANPGEPVDLAALAATFAPTPASPASGSLAATPQEPAPLPAEDDSGS